MLNVAVINRKEFENSHLKFIFFLPLAVTGCSLAVHVGSAAQSPHCVEQCVCHCFTRWEQNTKTDTTEQRLHPNLESFQNPPLRCHSLPIQPFSSGKEIVSFLMVKQWKGSNFTDLQLSKQSRDFSWGQNRCCGGTSGTWSHSGTCWSRRCRNTCPVGCSTLSWQGFPCPSGR